MVVLVTCKNEEDPIKNEGARVVTRLFIDISDAQGQLTPKSVMESCQNSNSSKLLQLVLLSARMKKIHPKLNALEWSQYFSYYQSMGIFPDAQGQLTHKSLVRSIQDVMVVVVTCNNKEEPIKNEVDRVVIRISPL